MPDLLTRPKPRAVRSGCRRVPRAAHDRAGRLTAIARQFDATTNLTYAYDQVGNRTNSGHQPGTWSYNQDNQLTRYPRLKPCSGYGTKPTDTQVSYTAQGHISRETSALGQRDYTYNAAERLIRYVQSEDSTSIEADYNYDPFGRRISKSVTQNGTTVNIYFAYSAQSLIAELNDQGQMTKAYGFNPQMGEPGLWSTDALWQANVANNKLTDTNTSFYLHNDQRYEPMLATDSDGQVAWKSISEAFGSAGILQNTIAVNLRLPGQYFDEETRTNYNFQRDYRPTTGRYAQSDPIGLDGGIHLYGYVGQNPVNWVDPEGLVKNILFKPGTYEYIASQNSTQDTPADYSVYAHGAPGVLSRTTNRKDSISPSELAEIIRNDPNYIPGTPIDLRSCFAATGGDKSYAAQLSKIMGVTVLGCDGYTVYNRKMWPLQSTDRAGVPLINSTHMACLNGICKKIP